MVFGFSKKDDLRALNQRMGRFLNAVTFSDLGEEKQRTESRVRLAQPCIAFLFEEANAPKAYAIGVTREISLHGMSMLVEGELDRGDYVLILNGFDERIMLKATCKHCDRDNFGMFAIGFIFSKVLAEKDYPAILDVLSHFASSQDDTEDATTANSKSRGKQTTP